MKAIHGAKAVLLDYGNTLVYWHGQRTSTAALRSVQQLVKRLGVKVDVERVREVVESYHHRSRPLGIEDEFSGILTELGAKNHDRYALRQAIQEYSQPWVNDAMVRKGVKESLHYLRQMGLKTGIVANIWSGWMNPVLEREDLGRFLDVRVASIDVGFQKPDPRIFRLALKELGAEPEETLMVGDGPETDIWGAHLLGMVTVRLLRGPRRMQPDKVEPTFKIRDVDALLPLLESSPKRGHSGKG